jgi:hypothetical protein
MQIDPRVLSQISHCHLTMLVTEPDESELNHPSPDSNYIRDLSLRKKASAIVQGLPAYISTWGLHRLAGDAQNFLAKTSENTQYKGKVYRQFLLCLREATGGTPEFDPKNEGTLIHLDLSGYTALNRLSMRLAQEWSFWATSVLGEADNG